jgi:hypothetical protein
MTEIQEPHEVWGYRIPTVEEYYGEVSVATWQDQAPKEQPVDVEPAGGS